MKKIFVFIAAAISGLACVSAQNFTLKVLGTEIKGGETIEACAKVDFNEVWEVKAYMELTNTSSSDIQVLVKATLAEGETLQDGCSLSLCGFGLCRDGLAVLGPETVEAGKTIGQDHVMDAFDFAYAPSMSMDVPYPGLTINCTVTDVTADKSVYFSIKFDPNKEPSVANEDVLSQVAISAYPNPATSEVNFRLDGVKAGSFVVLRDLSGKIVRRMPTNGDAEMNMSLSGLTSGMYFYSVEENGSTVAVGKLMVR